MVGLFLRDGSCCICLTVSYRAQKINIARKECDRDASRAAHCGRTHGSRYFEGGLNGLSAM
jgi:hypothetical protein